MKLRRSLQIRSIVRPRARQTWNKLNLYNLSRHAQYMRKPHGSFFQQKWAAKSVVRAYHGEHIKEGQWERMFSRRLASVVNMDPVYMAQHDGSEQASGRGSGKDLATRGEGEWDEAAAATNRRTGAHTPYMQMTFAPMERRLDIAIFRAMFASSARQAKQFVTHGFVKVNGKEMRFPGYLLNPGDMFQVEPDRVMMAVGRPKLGAEALKLRREHFQRKNAHLAKIADEDSAEESANKADAAAEGAAAEGEGPEGAEAEGAEAEGAAEAELSEEEKIVAENAKTLRNLHKRARAILEAEGDSLKAKRKINLRAFVKEANSALSAAGKTSATADATTVKVDELTELFKHLTASLELPKKLAEEPIDVAAEGTNDATKQSAADKASPPSPARRDTVESLTPEERAQFDKLLARWNETDSNNLPYAVPWGPRRYLAPFAFIPRYLEVNQNVCSAVYLRHPVARAGQSEVPSPFPEHFNQLAFNWYLRRR